MKLDDGAEFVYGADPLADWWDQPVEEEQEQADVKELFLRWVFTTDQNNRWTDYQLALYTTAFNAVNEKSVEIQDGQVVYNDPEVEALIEQVNGQYLVWPGAIITPGTMPISLTTMTALWKRSTPKPPPSI